MVREGTQQRPEGSSEPKEDIGKPDTVGGPVKGN